MFRVVNGEKAEVLAFTTHADSGKMPGLAASMGLGELVLGPITAITAIEDAASSGQKIYSSQIEYLAGETSDQVARYLSQYARIRRIGFRGARRSRFIWPAKLQLRRCPHPNPPPGTGKESERTKVQARAWG